MTRAVAWACFVAWAAAVWWLSSRSRPATDLRWPWETPDKVAHALEYAVGGFLARAALAGTTACRSGRASPTLAAVLLCAAWGFVDEIHQGFVPGRMTDPGDLAADTAGAAAGAALHAFVVLRVTRTERSSR